MRRRLIPLVLTTFLVSMLAVPAMAQDERPTGLERARMAQEQAAERAQDRMAEAKGANADNAGKARGLERAAEAIAAGLERGNGNGNAFGRGHAADVLAALLAGESPSELGGKHGKAVSEMVRTYNELKRQQRDSD